MTQAVTLNELKSEIKEQQDAFEELKQGGIKAQKSFRNELAQINQSVVDNTRTLGQKIQNLDEKTKTMIFEVEQKNNSV